MNGRASSFRLPQGSLNLGGGALEVRMQLPKFGENRKIKRTCAVAEQLPYAMIIGRDLIEHLGLILDFKAGEFIWEGVRVSIRSSANQSMGEQVESLLASAPPHQESSIAQAERRQIEILDADYKKEPLDEQAPDYLSPDEQTGLLISLTCSIRQCSAERSAHGRASRMTSPQRDAIAICRTDEAKISLVTNITTTAKSRMISC